MKNTITTKFLSGIFRQLLIAAALTSAFAFSSHANEPQNSSLAATPAALGPPGGLDFLLAVHPTVGRPNQTRTVFLQSARTGCSSYAVSVDTSLMETQSLVVLRTQNLPVFCGVPPPPTPARHDLEFTPTKVGTLTVRWDRGGPDTTIQVVPDSVASKYDTNGMWFDAATNGSGIALHHRRATTDVSFGTWFMFNNSGESRWYTLQSANWLQGGSVLEGLLLQVAGTCFTSGLAACPASGGIAFGQFPATKFGAIPALARITFQSATRARAEVLTLSGTAIFTSELTKLSF